MSNYLILGATSGIAQSFVEEVVRNGESVFLVARNVEKLESLKNHLKSINPTCVLGLRSIDLCNVELHLDLVKDVCQKFNIENVLISYGVLGNEAKAQDNYSVAYDILHTNLMSSISLLTHLKVYFRSIQKGTIAVITSVAGDRGRQSNYTYGTSKGALSIYLSGLRNSLYNQGINVPDIRPGFVDTPMTKDFKKGALWSSPEQVAKLIFKAIKKGRRVVYVPGFWWFIMFVIKMIPRRLFDRLRL